MNKNRYGFVVGGLFVVWTAVILLLSLVPGDELPPAGWLARIPHFDKIVHCGFYLIETGLLVLWVRLSPRGKFWIVAGVVAFSGVIELVQSVCGRSADWLDWAANALGAMAGVPAAIWFGKRIGQGTRASRK